MCLCVHLFFGAGPAQGVFFSGCCLLYQHISTIRASGFVPCSGIDPSFRNEKMRKCRCVWHEKLVCIARVFCCQICREAVCSLTTDIGDHWCIYTSNLTSFGQPFCREFAACMPWLRLAVIASDRVAESSIVSACFRSFFRSVKKLARGVWFFNVYPFSCF